MNASAKRISAQVVSEEFLTSKVQFLTDIHLWPERQILDPHRWLKNFRPSELPYAFNLLNVFLFFNEPLVDALLRAAIHRLSSHVSKSAASLTEATKLWESFLHRIRVTYVQGETPNPTDSGLTFARKARQVLGIDEAQIVTPAEALRDLKVGATDTVVLVDDFVGGGSQMRVTWQRDYYLGTSYVGSFSTAAARGASVIYAPLVATTFGLDFLDSQCFDLKVTPVHVLDSKYSLTSKDSILWPATLKATAPDVLQEISKRARIVDEYEHGWQGYKDLALAIGFWHSIPDATLPIYFWEHASWSPLIRRA